MNEIITHNTNTCVERKINYLNNKPVYFDCIWKLERAQTDKLETREFPISVKGLTIHWPNKEHNKLHMSRSLTAFAVCGCSIAVLYSHSTINPLLFGKYWISLVFINIILLISESKYWIGSLFKLYGPHPDEFAESFKPERRTNIDKTQELCTPSACKIVSMEGKCSLRGMWGSDRVGLLVVMVEQILTVVCCGKNYLTRCRLVVV